MYSLVVSQVFSLCVFSPVERGATRRKTVSYVFMRNLQRLTETVYFPGGVDGSNRPKLHSKRRISFFLSLRLFLSSCSSLSSFRSLPCFLLFLSRSHSLGFSVSISSSSLTSETLHRPPFTSGPFADTCIRGTTTFVLRSRSWNAQGSGRKFNEWVLNLRVGQPAPVCDITDDESCN